jgi:hypothetical protein
MHAQGNKGKHSVVETLLVLLLLLLLLLRSLVWLLSMPGTPEFGFKRHTCEGAQLTSCGML